MKTEKSQVTLSLKLKERAKAKENLERQRAYLKGNTKAVTKLIDHSAWKSNL